MKCFLFISVTFAFFSETSGFQLGHDRRLPVAAPLLLSKRIQSMQLRASEDKSSPDTEKLSPTEIILENERRGPNDQLPLETSSIPDNDDDSSRYPLNFPSPLLLSSSIILSIVSTGSLFQFLDTKELTNAIPSVVGFPIAIFLFYAAITKAIVETEEDDRKFMSEKK